MREISPDLRQKIIGEDPWIGSENGVLYWHLIHLGAQKICVEFAEIDTVHPVYGKSAALHCFLGDLYLNFSEELSDDFKLMIERLKFERIGRPDLLDLRKKPVSEITASLPHKGQDISENWIVGWDYLSSHNIGMYLRLGNLQRANTHFMRSLELSGENPTVFRELIQPTILLYMTPFVVQAGLAIREGFTPRGYPLIGWVNDAYKSAEKRIKEMKLPQ